MSFNPYSPPVGCDSPAEPTSQDITRHVRGFEYPLAFSCQSFSLIAQTADLVDGLGRSVLHIRRKVNPFRVEEGIWTDATRMVQLGNVRSRITSFGGVRHEFRNAQGELLGSLVRKQWLVTGLTRYQVFGPDGGEPWFSIRKDGVLSRVRQWLAGRVSLWAVFQAGVRGVGHLAEDREGVAVMRISKDFSYARLLFRIEKSGDLDRQAETVLLLALLSLRRP